MAVWIVSYGFLGLRKQWKAVSRATDPTRQQTLRVVARVNTVRWAVIAAIFAAAFYIDATCEPTPESPDRCMEMMLAAGTALIAVTVTAEIVGHRIVRREISELVEDPPAPAPPTPLRIVKDEDADGDDRGPLV